MYFVEIDLDRIPDTFPQLKEWIETINSLRSTPVGIVLAIDDDQALGVMIHADGRLYQIVVQPSARKQGVGRDMLGFIKNRYNYNVTAYVPVSNTAAIGFFSIMGYEVAGTMKDLEDVLCLRMVLRKAPKKPAPSEETVLVHYLKNTPVFVSVAEKMM